MIEKPACVDSGDLSRLVAGSVSTSAHVAVGYVLRSLGAVAFFRHYLKSGKVGDVNSVIDRRLAYRPECETHWWKGFPLHLIGFQGVHSFDLMRWIFGDLELKDVNEIAWSSNVDWIDTFRITFQAGATPVETYHSFQWQGVPENTIRVIAGRGVLELKNYRQVLFNNVLLYDDGESWLREGFRKQATEFLSVPDGSSTALCSVEDAQAILEFVNAVIERA